MEKPSSFNVSHNALLPYTNILPECSHLSLWHSFDPEIHSFLALCLFVCLRVSMCVCVCVCVCLAYSQLFAVQLTVFWIMSVHVCTSGIVMTHMLKGLLTGFLGGVYVGVGGIKPVAQTVRVYTELFKKCPMLFGASRSTSQNFSLISSPMRKRCKSAENQRQNT